MQYPAAFEVYAAHCRSFFGDRLTHNIDNITSEQSGQLLTVRLPLGTALVIPPQAADIARHHRRHWVVCLFASWGYGRRVDSTDIISNHLNAALQDLSQQLTILRMEGIAAGTDYPRFLFSNRFCSGLFRLPWNHTRQLIDAARLSITVCFPVQASVRRGRRPVRLQSPDEEAHTP